MCARRGGCGSVGGFGRYGMGTSAARRVPGPASRGGPGGGVSEGASRGGGSSRGFSELEGTGSGLRLVARRVGGNRDGASSGWEVSRDDAWGSG